MPAHNLMEDAVVNKVHEICDEINRIGNPKQYCISEQCRLDVICYVLNRISPKYVTSGRGFAHVESMFNHDPQIEIDIVTLINEGLQRISSNRRPYYRTGFLNSQKEHEGPYFNFPPVKGRLFNGINFEPAFNVSVSLFRNDKLVEMVDSNWQNPFELTKNTEGNFLFLPAPQPAQKKGETKIFEFEIRVQNAHCEELQHFFKLHVTAERYHSPADRFLYEYKLTDMYIFPS